jgi:hypothetical protein
VREHDDDPRKKDRECASLSGLRSAYDVVSSRRMTRNLALDEDDHVGQRFTRVRGDERRVWAFVGDVGVSTS